MAITGLTVTLDRTNYSRYEENASTIVASVQTVGSTPGDLVTVELRRKMLSGERVISTVPHTMSGAALFSVQFPLDTMVDADGFSTARISKTVNDYRVVATAGSVSASAKFTVTPITVEAMRGSWLLGLPLYTVEKIAPRLQPLSITGVTVTDVSRGMPLGVGTLALTVSAGPVYTLAWAGGASRTVTIKSTYLLPDKTGQNYIMVAVDPALLNATTVSDVLFMDYGQMPDADILGRILATAAEIERDVVPFEPKIIVSPRLIDSTTNPGFTFMDWDEVRDGGLYEKAQGGQWATIKLPVRRILRVYELHGFFNRSKGVTVTPEWITFSERGGSIDLVPSNYAILNWGFAGLGLSAITLIQGVIPDFWQYRLLSGLRAWPTDVMEFLGKRAAIPILTQAAMARYPSGVTSTSTSRDGVSESRSIMPGVYAATIEQYKDDTGMVQGTDRGIAKLRQQYRGLIFTSI